MNYKSDRSLFACFALVRGSLHVAYVEGFAGWAETALLFLLF